jgi:hypothetical protein
LHHEVKPRVFERWLGARRGCSSMEARRWLAAGGVDSPTPVFVGYVELAAPSTVEGRFHAGNTPARSTQQRAVRARFIDGRRRQPS